MTDTQTLIQLVRQIETKKYTEMNVADRIVDSLAYAYFMLSLVEDDVPEIKLTTYHVVAAIDIMTKKYFNVQLPDTEKEQQKAKYQDECHEIMYLLIDNQVTMDGGKYIEDHVLKDVYQKLKKLIEVKDDNQRN